MSIFDTAIDLTDVPKTEWNKYIGKGYSSVSYITNHERHGVIVLIGFDTNGNPQTFLCPHKSHIKYNVGYKTGEKDVYDNYVETKWFNSSYERKQYLDQFKSSLNIVECLRPESEFLHEMFDDVALDGSFNKQKMRIHFLDIETEISETFEKPVDARNRINMLTIYDNYTEKYYTWSLHHADINFKEEPLKDISKDRFEFFEFNNSESRMLRHFLNWTENNYPNVYCTWNGQAYDIPYIVRRLENVLGKEEAKKISPIGKYFIKQNNLDNERANKQAEIVVDISGVFSADELILYRDKFKIKNPLDGGYALDNVGEAEGLGKKIHYHGTLKDLYEKDYQKFYEYNVRDVDLLMRIEEKCKLIPLSRIVVGSGLCNYDTIYSSISYLIGSLVTFTKTQKNKVFNSYLNQENEPLKYEGAYVFDPIPGLYKNGIATVDYNSLYPSSIRAGNISPETYIGILDDDWFDQDINEFCLNVKNVKLLSTICKAMLINCARKNGVDFNDNDALIELAAMNDIIIVDSKSIMVTRKMIQKLLDHYCIITKNNTILSKHEFKEGVVPSWCAFFYNLRKTTKKKMQEYKHKIYTKEISGEEDVKNTHNLVDNLNASQKAYKIMINSIYGILGTSFSPIYCVDLAQSITRTGKFCNISSAKFIRDYFKEHFNTSDDYIYTISGDTDSQFINIECITSHFKKEYNLPDKIFEWSDEYKLKLWDYVDGFVEKTLNPFVHKLVKENYHTSQSEVLRYSLEYIGDNGIYEAKKHYGVRKIVLEEREISDKIKYSGIELKKANIPISIKKFLGDIYSNTLTKDWTENDFRQYINNAYNKFVTMDIEDISFWKGYNTKRDSDGFLSMAKSVNSDGVTVGTTSISAAVTYYNQILKKLNIGNKYDEILLGDKCRFAYVVPNNKFGIKYIAFKDGQYPDEFRNVFSVDYNVMFNKLILSPLKNYLVATGFSDVDPRIQLADDISDL